MSDLKVVLYKENRAPRTLALSTRTIYRTLFLAAAAALVLFAASLLAVKFYLLNREKIALAELIQTEIGASGTPSSLEEQNRELRGQIELLNERVRNQAVVQAAPKSIDSASPALALFTPNVVDKTDQKNRVAIRNFKFTPGTEKSPMTLTFELHNATEGGPVQKGYIVVLARTDKDLKAYPDVFNRTGPYLAEFEKGETFQVARFRMVNAQFDLSGKPAQLSNFQILIFSGNGELLINQMHEVKSGGA